MMEVEHEQYVDQYEIVSLAGEGMQASVYLCRKNGQEFALKVFRFGASNEHAFERQVEILQRACHPNLVAMIDNRPRARYKIRYHDEEIRPVIVLELEEGDELFLYLSKTGRFTSELSRYYIRQLLAAIKYLHQIGITHRDLKPQNILFDFNFMLKLSDFGHSKEKTGLMNTNRVGTDGYRAPEIQTGVYDGLKVDIFSAGVILFIMYTGSIPFLSTRANDQIYKQIRSNRFAQFWQLHQRNKLPGFFPDSFKKLINSMLSADPNQRPSLQALEQDEWLNGQLPGSPALIAEMTSRAIRLGLRAYQRRNSQIIPANLQAMRGQPHRSSLDLFDQTTTKQDVFSCIYNSLFIQAQTLPQYSLKNVIYSTKNANLALSWVHCFFFEEWKANTVFLEDHVEDIKFVRYEVKHNLEDFQVQVRLDFQVNKENETQLVLLGKLHRSLSGNVGLDWKKIEGNSYWLSSIIFYLNESFKSLT